MVGDLKYGCIVYFLIQVLVKFNGNCFYFIVLDVLVMLQYIFDMFDEKGIVWSLYSVIDDVMVEVDILYMICVQKECLDLLEYVNVKVQFVLCVVDFEGVCVNMKVLYLLLCIDEIIIDVDKILYVWYFQQVGNGIFVCQVLLVLVLNSELVL